MAFFKRIQKKNNLWYPQSVTWGKTSTSTGGSGSGSGSDSGNGGTSDGSGDDGQDKNPLG